MDHIAEKIESHEGISTEELDSLLTVEDLLHVHVRPRFPIAVMHWYSQYSNPESARAGTIAYAQSLTPGLTEETAGMWIDKLVAEQAKPEPVVVKAVPVEAETDANPDIGS